MADGRVGGGVAIIKVRQNGPYLVEGDDVTVVDWNGSTYQLTKRPFALCRCGGSTNKPFCDGTHSRLGFQAAEAAVAGSEDKPAQ
jgi:CDGSH-type Zn-finger protein